MGLASGLGLQLGKKSADSLKFQLVSWSSGACSTRDPCLYTQRSRKWVVQNHPLRFSLGTRGMP